MFKGTEEKFFITGATGFVGSCLVRELVKKNKNVHIIVRDKWPNWRLHDIVSKITIHECDLLDDRLNKILNQIKPDYIFHLAAYGTIPAHKEVQKMMDINIQGTVNLLKAATQNKFKLFINSGSSSEYGLKDSPMSETDILCPINDYGVTKVAATLFCQKIGKTQSLPIITFRLFSPYGYYEDKNRLFPYLLINAIKNGQINLGFPYYVRDFIFVEDVVSAYLKATQLQFIPGDIFNIGTGVQHFTSDVADIVLKLTKSKSKVVWGAAKNRLNLFEPKRWEADMSKTKNALQWEPQYDLKEGIKKTFQWFLENKNIYAK